MTARKAQHCPARVAAVAAAFAASFACSPSPERDAPRPPAEPMPPPPDDAERPVERGVSGLVDDDESRYVPVGEAEACAAEQANTVVFKDPVDIIVVVDNSASMGNELAATESNINQNFAAILGLSQLDYRMIVLTLHRRVPRTGFGQSATMLCVTKPLSGLDDCTTAPEPVFSDHFFHYSTRIESDDSLDILLDTYEPPFDNEDREDEFGNAPLGWSEWLRPGVKKVFLELSDDNEDLPPAEFVRALTELAPEHFGADPADPQFIFHSIVGVAEKTPATEPYFPADAIQAATCEKLGSPVSTAGETYQELSRLTGGLRFPICGSSVYDVVFREIAGRVVEQSDIACDFPVPAPPPGRTLDLDRVSVEIEHETMGVATTRLGQARLATECQADAFYIEGATIRLCPDVCDAVRAEAGAGVNVLFGCESSIIVR